MKIDLSVLLAGARNLLGFIGSSVSSDGAVNPEELDEAIVPSSDE